MNLNQRTFGIILSYLIIFLNMAINFLYVPLLIKNIGQNEYGIYQLMGSLIAYFSIMDFGLSATLIKYYSKFKLMKDIKKSENVLGMCRRIYLILTIIMLLVGIAIFYRIDNIFGNSLSFYEINEAKKIYLFLLINISFTLLGNIYNSIIISEEKFIFLRLLNLIQILVQPIFIIILIKYIPKAITVTLIMTSFNLITFFIKMFFSKKIIKIKIKFHFLDKKLLKELLMFSGSVFIISICDQIFWRGNQILIGSLKGAIEVAYYSVGAQIYMNVIPLSTSIQSILLPKIMRLSLSNNKDISDYFLKISRIQYMVLGCFVFGFISLGKEFVKIWVGEGYIISYWIAVLILIPLLIELSQNIGYSIMQAKDCYSFRAKILLGLSFFNIFLSYILIKKIGIIGAAVSTSFSLLLGNVIIMNIFYWKKLKIDIIKYWSNIIKISLIYIIASGCIFFIKKKIVIIDILDLLINAFIFFLISSILLYNFALDKTVKKTIRREIKVIVSKINKRNNLKIKINKEKNDV